MATVVNTGVLSVSGGTGITVSTVSGAVTITSSGIISVSGGAGISVTTASGVATVVNTGVLSVSGGAGISVTTSASGVATVVNTGVLSVSGGTGINVTTSASGAVTITSSGVLSVSGGAGINVTTASGVAIVVNTGVLSVSGGAGITVSTSASGAVTITNSGVLSVSGGAGINVTTTASGVATVVNTGILSVSGGAGITVSTSASGVATVVNTGILSVSGGTGINVTTSASGAVTITSSGVLSVSGGAGINVTTASGVATVVNTGVLSVSGGTGINVTTSASGAVTITSSGVLSVSGGTGIDVTTVSGVATVVNKGIISVSGGAGITVTTVSGVATITATGSSASGVLSVSGGTNITISGTASVPIISVATALTGLTANPVSASGQLLQFNRTYEATAPTQAITAPIYPKETATLINAWAGGGGSVLPYSSAAAAAYCYLASTTGRTFVGGDGYFNEIDAAGAVITSWPVTGQIYCVCDWAENGFIVLGGSFTSIFVNGVATPVANNRVVFVTGSNQFVPFIATTETFGSGPFYSCCLYTVRLSADGEPYVFKNVIVFGGDFTLTIQGYACKNIATYSWDSFTTAFVSWDAINSVVPAANFNAPVRAVDACNDYGRIQFAILYVGGDFTVPQSYMAVWYDHLSEGFMQVGDGPLFLNGSVSSLLADKSTASTTVYVGGTFTGPSTPYACLYSAYVGQFQPMVLSPSGPVTAITATAAGGANYLTYDSGSWSVATPNTARFIVSDGVSPRVIWGGVGGSSGMYQYDADGVTFTTAVPIAPTGATSLYLASRGDTAVLQASTDLAQWYVLEQTPALTSVAAGAGIGVSTVSGVATVTNTGILSVGGGAGISVNTATGVATVTNTGVLSVSGGAGISVSTVSGVATVTNSGVLSVAAGTNINLTGTAAAPIVNVNTALTGLTANPVSASGQLLQFNRTIQATAATAAVPAPIYPKETATLINYSATASPIQPFFSEQIFNTIVPYSTDGFGSGFMAGGDQVATCSADGGSKTYYSPLASGSVKAIKSFFSPAESRWTNLLVGDFTTASAGSYCIAFDGVSFLPVTLNGMPSFPITAIEYDGTYLYLGGIGTPPTGGVYRLSGSLQTWTVDHFVNVENGTAITAIQACSIPALSLAQTVIVTGDFISPLPYWFAWDAAADSNVTLPSLGGSVLCIALDGTNVLVGGGFPGFAQTYDTTTNALLGFPAQFTYGASFPVTSISAIHLGSGNAGVGVLTLVAPPVGGFLVPLAGLLNGLVALSDGTVVWTCYHPVYEPSNGSYQYPATVSAITFTTTIPIVPSGATSLTLPHNGDTAVLQASEDLAHWFVLEQPSTGILSVSGGAGISVSTTGGVATVTNTGLLTTPGLAAVLAAGNSASQTAVWSAIGSNVNVDGLGFRVNNLSTSNSNLTNAGLTVTVGAANSQYKATGVTSTGALTIASASGQALTLSGGSVVAPTVTPSTDSSTKVATTAFVQSAIGAAAISSQTQTTSPVTLTSASAQNQVLTGSLAYIVNLPSATTLAVGRSFIFNVNTSAVAYTATIRNAAGTALFNNAQQGSIIEAILLTNATTAGTWDFHSYLPSGANFGNTGLVYQGNLTFTGSGTSVISQSGSGNISITAPTLTGVPLAPTAAPGTNSTQIATTAFVAAAVSGGGVTSFSAGSTGLTPAVASTGAVTLSGTLAVANGGTGVTTSTGTGSNVLSAAPTLTGVPLAPTATVGTNTQQIATTAFVAAAVAGATIPTYDQVLNAGSTATNRIATITSATNNTAVSASGFTASNSTANTYTTVNNTGIFATTTGGRTCNLQGTGMVVSAGSDNFTFAPTAINASSAGGQFNAMTSSYFKVENATDNTAITPTGMTISGVASGATNTITAALASMNTTVSGVAFGNSRSSTYTTLTNGTSNTQMTATGLTVTDAAGTNVMNGASDTITAGTNNTVQNATGFTATTSAGTNVMNGASDTITAGTNNTVQNATGFTATTSAGTNAMIGASNTITAGANATTFTSTGYTATVSGTNQIVALSTTPSIIVGSGSNYTNTSNGNINIYSTGSGYTATYQIQIQNNTSAVGNTTGVPSVHYYKNGRSAVANDVIGSQHYFGKNASGTKTEFAIIEGVVRTATTGAEAGGLDFSADIAGAMTKFMRISGNNGYVDMLRTVNMNGNIFQTTAGDITINAASSAGTGVINLTTKAGTAGSGAGLVLAGNTLLASAAGAASGQYLTLTISGVVYKIPLLLA